MFTIDTTITDLKVRERNLSKVLFSMNIHQVATPELSAEDAKSYIFFFREGGRFLSYIGLYFLHSDRKLYYSYTANPFSESELPDVESEARSFAEDMGAMLDELEIAKLSDLERDCWIAEQDIFSTKKQADEQSAAAGVDQRNAEPAVHSTPAVQPAPIVQPAPPTPEVQVAPPEQVAPIKPAPAPQPAPIIQPEAPSARIAQSMPEPEAEPLEQSQVQAPVSSPAAMPDAPVQPPVPSRPQRKQVTTPRQPAGQPKTAVPVPEPAGSADEVLEQAVKAGIVKAPKQPLTQDIRNANGAVSRDKEALVRLLASF
jgi:hypothetical protein